MNVFECLSDNLSFQDALKEAKPGPEIVPSPKLGCLKPDCGSCDSHHFGWCRAVPGKPFYNIKFLRACPLEDSECEALTVNGRHELNIDQKTTLPSNGVTA